MHMHDRDGITAWAEILADFDNDGSIPLRVDALEAFLQSPFTVAYVGGVTSYIDRFQASLAELDGISGEEAYPDSKKK